jgi:drug/metabolite transporter (DMT)-like permease
VTWRAQSGRTLRMQWKSKRRLDVLALLGGATGIGFAPILVRMSEVGPSATAFYRLFFALPFLWLATMMEPKPRLPTNAPGGADRSLWLCACAGVLFAGDLACWHWSIKLTSVANSTLLTNCAPFFVVLGARTLFSERITVLLLVGMGVAAIGAAMLVGASLQLTPRHLFGDGLGLITAAFYGGYLLTVKYLRLSLSTARVLAWSGLVSSACLLLIAWLSHEAIRIRTGRGFAVLLALGLVSHVGGQGLIAYALARLPAGFSSVGLLFQPVVAAALAWTILGEPLSPLQTAGGTIILLGIVLASQSQRQARHAP